MAKRPNPAEPEDTDRQTRLSEERTLLEHERTLAAWIRTGLAAIVVGFAAAELFQTVEPMWLAQVIGAALIAAGAVLLAAAYQSYRGSVERLRQRRVPGIAPWGLMLFVLALILGAIAGLYLILA